MTDASRYDGRRPEPPYDVGDEMSAALAVMVNVRDAEITRLQTALREVEAIVEDRADADDGKPNDAMRILVLVRAALAQTGGRS